MTVPAVRRTLPIYLVAVAAVIATIGLRAALRPVLGDNAPLILLLLPVSFMAWIGGFWPGLFTTVFGCVIGMWLFVPHQTSDYHGMLPYWIGRSVPFSVVGCFISFFAAHLEQARMQAKDSEDRLRLVFESVQDYAIFTTDLTGRVTSWNIGARRVFGYGEADIVGLPADHLYTPEDRATQLPKREMDHAMRDGRAIEERWLIRQNGTRLVAEGVIAVLRDEAGQPTGFTRVCRDVTDARNAAHEREQLLISERAARSEAERVSRMKDEFLATLSHELRTPLNAILGWSQIMKRDPSNASDIEQGVDVIERNARGQSQIIEDLLDMSRIISGKVRLDVREVDLSSLVQAAVETARPAAEAKGVRLVSGVLPHRPVLVNGDPNRLQQVLWNLLSNAVKFTPKGGTVEADLKPTESDVVLRVVDTGDGISSSFLPFVFDRFRQADATTTRRYGGLGLGLSIVKHIVELHGGSVSVDSAGVGHGSTFTVSMPRLAPAAEPEPQYGRPPPAVSGNGLWTEAINLTGVKCLVVDDEPDARALVKRLLEDCSATVTTAGSAADAIEQLGEDQPDILVSDIGMPGEDGYALIRQVRARSHEQGGSMPAIALTAYARAEDRVKAVVGGFQMHLAKPVEPSELIAMVATLTGRTTSTNSK